MRLAALLLLLLPSAVHAGDTIEMSRGAFRAFAMELREWQYWQASCDGMLFQDAMNGNDDAEAISVHAPWWIHAQWALAEWRAEKERPIAERAGRRFGAFLVTAQTPYYQIVGGRVIAVRWGGPHAWDRFVDSLQMDGVE